jgi:hypothetical protein
MDRLYRKERTGCAGDSDIVGGYISNRIRGPSRAKTSTMVFSPPQIKRGSFPLQHKTLNMHFRTITILATILSITLGPAYVSAKDQEIHLERKKYFTYSPKLTPVSGRARVRYCSKDGKWAYMPTSGSVRCLKGYTLVQVVS